MARDFRWQGRTEEELKQLDLQTFMALVPARRRRSLQRGFTEQEKKLLKKIENGEQHIKTHCRSMVIIPSLLGQTIHVYTGKVYVPIIIVAEMLGHCLGEFAHTRKLVSHSSAGVGATRSSKAISAR